MSCANQNQLPKYVNAHQIPQNVSLKIKTKYFFYYFQEAISFVDVSPTDALVTPGLGDTFNEYMKDVISKFFKI